MSNEELEEQARIMRNQYIQQWRAKNKDKVREANHRHWLKKAKNQLAEKRIKERGEKTND